MPHKHTRRPTPTSTSTTTHDLPPTTLALPLPVPKTRPSTRPRPRPKADADNDTPRAFLRLLSNHAPPSGLDDGPIPPPPPKSKTKKRKRGVDDDEDTSHALKKDTQQSGKEEEEGQKRLHILPNEHTADFSARVDRAIPITRALVVGKGGRQSRLERKMQRMQGEWRDRDRERRRREVEARDEADWGGEGDREDGGGGGKKKKKGKKGKGKKKGRESEDEDPWAVVQEHRRRDDGGEEGKGKGLVGLHDVVEAPPRFERKVGGGTVRMGGLKRQVEMGEARREVVEGYRRMMAQRREAKGGMN